MSKFKPLILASLLVLAVVGWQLTAHAAAPSSVGTFGTTVSPPILELDGTPGQLIHSSIKVTNSSSGPLSYATTVENFTVGGTEGAVTINTDSSSRYAASTWVGLSQKAFTLAPHITEVFNFTVTIPANAEPGGHYAVILFQPNLATTTQSTGAATIPQVGSLILLSLPGATTEHASIVSLHPKTFTGSWVSELGTDGKTHILVATGENLNAEHAEHFFFNGHTVAFDTLFKNTGTVHVEPTGTMTITNLFGKKSAILALDPHDVFPGSERRITTIWPGKWHWGFFYRAKVVALYGTSNQIITSSTWFIAFPWWGIVGIILVILLFTLARKRLKRVLRILVKGE